MIRATVCLDAYNFVCLIFSISVPTPVVQCAAFPLVQTKIIDFFRIRTSSEEDKRSPIQGDD